MAAAIRRCFLRCEPITQPIKRTPARAGIKAVQLLLKAKVPLGVVPEAFFMPLQSLAASERPLLWKIPSLGSSLLPLMVTYQL